jgi:hypothetical protein
MMLKSQKVELPEHHLRQVIVLYELEIAREELGVGQ